MYHINPLLSFSLLASIRNLSFPQLILNFHIFFGDSLTLFRVTYISMEHGQNLSVATLLGKITDSLAAPQQPLSVNSSLGRVEFPWRRIHCRWNGREEGRPTPSLNMIAQIHLCRQKWKFGPFPAFWDHPWKGRTHPQNFWLPLQESEQGVMRSVRKGSQDSFIWVYSDDMVPSFLLRWWLHDSAVELC